MNLDLYSHDIFDLLYKVNKKKMKEAEDLLLFCNGRVFVCGNGGSFSTAQHFSQDLVKAIGTYSISLGNNLSYLTALSNDISYEQAFLQEFMRSKPSNNDLLVLLSCSGNSKNVVNLAKYVYNNYTLNIIAFTGKGGGELKDYADPIISVNSDDYGTIEGIHSVLLHYLILSIKERIHG